MVGSFFWKGQSSRVGLEETTEQSGQGAGPEEKALPARHPGTRLCHRVNPWAAWLADVMWHFMT